MEGVLNEKGYRDWAYRNAVGVSILDSCFCQY